MRPLLCLALLAAAVCGSIPIRKRHSWNDGTLSRATRDTNKYDAWLTEEQIEELKKLDGKSADFKAKVMKFYNELPEETRKEWDSKYREYCNIWIEKVAGKEALSEYELLQKSDPEYAEKKRAEYLAKADTQTKGEVEMWKNECDELTGNSRSRRELTDEDKNWLTWLDEEKKKAIYDMYDAKTDENEIHEKVKTYFKELPEERQATLREEFKEKCMAWIRDVADSDEQVALDNAYEEEKFEYVKTKIGELYRRLPIERQDRLRKFGGVCRRLWKLEKKRLRRELDQEFEEFVSWMTDDQQQELETMKASGKSLNEIRTKSREFFKALPGPVQSEISERLKLKCKNYFTALSSEEEIAELKRLHEAGDDDAAKEKITAIVSRLPEPVKTTAAKMRDVCADVFAKSKKRRDVNEKIEKHLGWLTDEQKKQVREMHAAGKSKEEIRKVIFEFLNSMDSDSQKAAREQTRKECYKWLDQAATKEEVEELHKLHHVDHASCKKKVREYIQRLPADVKVEVEKNLPFCEKVWYGDHSSHSGHEGHHHHHRRRRHLSAIEKYIDWLTPEQKKSLQEMEEAGEEFNKILAKVKVYFSALAEDKQADLKEKFKNQCGAWVKEVATSSELEELKNLHSTSDFEGIKKMLSELETRLSEDQKHTVEHIRDACLAVWNVKESSRKRRSHAISMRPFLSWTTDDQQIALKEILDAGDDKSFFEKLQEFYRETEGSDRELAHETLASVCKDVTKQYFGEENIKEFMSMRQQGQDIYDLRNKLGEMTLKLDEQTQMDAVNFIAGCNVLFDYSRKRRDHHEHNLEDDFEKYLSWTTDEQKTELRKLNKEGKWDEIHRTIMQFFQELEGETKDRAAEGLKAACKHYSLDIFGEEKVAQIKALKDTGASLDDIEKKVEELIAQLPDDDTKSKAVKVKNACKPVFAHKPSRRRRDHPHTLENSIEKWLSWTTEDQRAELKKLESEGKKDDIYKAVLRFFAEAEGETKNQAAASLKAACKHYAVDIFGEEKVAEVKAVKDSGASVEDIEKKVNEIIAELPNDEAKEKANKVKDSCKQIFAYKVSRRRRDEHEHKIDDIVKNYLSWLTDDQKAEVKSLYEEGKKSDIYKKVLEYFESTTGDDRVAAAEQLKGACKHFGADIFGAEKVAEIKALRDSNAPEKEVLKKVEEFASSLPSDELKEKAARLIAGCSKVYKVASRKRRHDPHSHKLTDEFDRYLSWTTQEQKDQLVAVNKEGNDAALFRKILEFFEATTGDTRNTAAAELKSACKHFGEDIFGSEKVAKLKTLKETGAKAAEILSKLEEWAGELPNDEAKEKAAGLIAGCSKIYQHQATRKRRNHHLHSHDFKHFMENYLTWLNADQKVEVNLLEKQGNRPAIYKKVLEYYEATTGETHNQAREELKGACRHFGKAIFGNEKMEKVKEMKESGASVDEISKSFEKWAGELPNDELKDKAAQLLAGCAKVFKP